jgi:hypothetical protein
MQKKCAISDCNITCQRTLCSVSVAICSSVARLVLHLFLVKDQKIGKTCLQYYQGRREAVNIICQIFKSGRNLNCD